MTVGKNQGDRTFFKNIALEENVSNLTTRFVQDYNYFQIGSISLGYEMRRNYAGKSVLPACVLISIWEILPVSLR